MKNAAILLKGFAIQDPNFLNGFMIPRQIFFNRSTYPSIIVIWT